MIRSVLRKKTLSKSALLASLLALWCVPAHALQILEGADGSTLYAKISAAEPTRIAIEQGRVATMRIREGTVNIDSDEDTGQVFVTVPPGIVKPVSAFLTTVDGKTYTLILQPADIPAESIVIKSNQRRSSGNRGTSLKTTAYAKVAKKLITVMASDSISDDYEVRDVNKQFALWKEANLTLERQYIGDEFVGERFILSNVSKADMVLDEREFYRKGVHFVALDQLNLAPGSATRLYIVREKSADE